jgi:hypothetical protein
MIGRKLSNGPEANKKENNMTMTMDQAVQNYLSQGYVMIGSYGKSVQMKKPKGNPSCLLVIILFLLGILPGILYLIWHSVTPEQTVTLTADENGNYIEPVAVPSKPLSKGAIIAIVVVVILVVIACIASMSSQGNAPIGLISSLI